VKFAISLGMLNPRVWPDVTQEADRLGYDSVWLPEHLVFPVQTEGSPFHGADHPPVPADVPVFDAFTYLGFLAGRTERIRFSTHVYNIGLRHPFVSARAVATLDIVSGGRAEFGIGASWLRAEWDAVGLDFDSRGRRVDEAIEVCRRLWTEPVVEHHGEFFDFGPVMFEPKPVQQPHPPIFFGGESDAALERVAAQGQGWFGFDLGPEELSDRLAALDEKLGAHGRSRADIQVFVSPFRRPATPELIEGYAALGVDQVIVPSGGRDPEDAVGRLAQLASQVVRVAAG
jgi:probable F420-dependent oxidoreductase